jgi:hypothetical protein
MSQGRPGRAATACLMLIALSGCAGISEAALGGRDRPPPLDRDATEASSEKRGEGLSSAGDGRRSARRESYQDSLKTFGFASADTPRFARDLMIMSSTIDQMYGHSIAGDLVAVERDAKRLLSQAEQLEGDATSAARRLRQFNPSVRNLDGARKQAISAFARTARHAGAVADLTKAALRHKLQNAQTILGQLGATSGVGDGLGVSYVELSGRLQGWALQNPRAAAKARAKYGA